jgi:hypothetical protein
MPAIGFDVRGGHVVLEMPEREREREGKGGRGGGGGGGFIRIQ